MLLNGGAPTLVIGPTGTGKSVFIKKVVTQIMDQNIFKPIFLSYTAETSGNDAQRIVDGKVDKRRKGVFGPSFGCKALVFVDDVNMPEIEEYGAQAAVELLRQFCANSCLQYHKLFKLRMIVMQIKREGICYMYK